MELILTKKAKNDIRKASAWYNKKQQDLGEKFQATIFKELDYIAMNPEIYPFRYLEVRTAIVSVFPYMIHYYIDSESNQVIAFGIMHTSLSPKKWK